jgi:threonine dehydrogenase-like Zn-dependent dehydrogenase
MYGAGDVRVEKVPDARLIEPTDALLRITRACICGSDLWPYKTMERTNEGRRMGRSPAVGKTAGEFSSGGRVLLNICLRVS